MSGANLNGYSDGLSSGIHKLEMDRRVTYVEQQVALATAEIDDLKHLIYDLLSTIQNGGNYDDGK